MEDMATTMRDNPSSHGTLNLESFSLLSQLIPQIQEKKYESEVFEAEGNKWRLSLHLNGDKERGDDGHISLYLKIVETQTLPLGRMVGVNFKLFLYNHIRGKYYTYQGK
ncbi:hypothetical protein SLA2020_314080 [Shorea laevis]